MSAFPRQVYDSVRRVSLVIGVAAVVVVWCGARDTQGEDTASRSPSTANFGSDVDGDSADAKRDDDSKVARIAALWKKVGWGTGSLDEAQIEALIRRIEAESRDSANASAGRESAIVERRYGSESQPANNASDHDAWVEYDARRWNRPTQTTADSSVGEADERRIAGLRKAARAIDELAADLEAEEMCDEADQLFGQAQVLRLSARRIRKQQTDSPVSDAAHAALQYNLHALRTQLQLYRSEHGGRNPEVKPDADGNPSLPQLCAATNETGEIGAGAAYRLGPYLLSVPRNPLAPDEATGHSVIEIDHWPPRESAPKGGWYYHAKTGQIAPNTPGYSNE